MELVNRFKDSEDELVVIRGLQILKLFFPYAKDTKCAVTNESVPGDLVFDEMKTVVGFKLVDSKEWSTEKTLHYVRTK